MEVYCVQVEFKGERPSDNWTAHTLWSTLEGAKRDLKQERDEILSSHSWLNNEDCIDTDEEDHFCAVDGWESYNIAIIKETVHE